MESSSSYSTCNSHFGDKTSSCNSISSNMSVINTKNIAVNRGLDDVSCKFGYV